MDDQKVTDRQIAEDRINDVRPLVRSLCLVAVIGLVALLFVPWYTFINKSSAQNIHYTVK
jgi:hypothetical protein